ncbi:MAG: hypothetical protein ABI597_10765 [Gammaproteobacteria bacterium]
MGVELYLVGIDLIVDNNNNIRILELQNAYESNIARADELTNLKPIERLKKSVHKAYPNFSVDEPILGEVDGYARRVSKSKPIQDGAKKLAEVKKSDSTILVNRGIEAKARAKWLFYATCNENPTLRNYIPRTIIATLNTVDTVFKVEELQNKRFIFKPGDMSRGDGIVLIPETLDSQGKLLEHLTAACLALPVKDHFKNRPFLIQEYLHDGSASCPKSKPVIRVYAAVVWDHSKSKLFISIDTQAAYQHVRINQAGSDFTLSNNKHEPCNIEGIKSQVNNFLRDFFTFVIAQQVKITHRSWENLAKKYIRDHRNMTDEERLMVLSQFAMAVSQEQRFTENRLSHYQCFVLEEFVECYKARDAKLSVDNGLAQFITNAFGLLAKYNLFPYASEKNYPLHSVIKSYEKIVISTLPERFAQGFQFAMKVVKDQKSTKPYLMGAGITFFDYLAREDIDALSATSSGCLSLVAGYARRKS